MILETKKRTIVKSATWRLIATANSFAILSVGLNHNLYSAILMNITGFIIYYIFERIFNKIQWGKYEDNGSR
jgi:hypothetical protein